MHREIKYYVNGHTAEGFVNFLTSNLIDIDKTIVLQHASNIVKTKVLKKLAEFYRKNNDIEIISSPQSKDYIDGIIVRGLSLAILAESDHQSAIRGTFTIDLTKYVPDDKEDKNSNKLAEMTKLYEEAYAHFKLGLTIHDDLEKVYINEMDFTKADKEAENFIGQLFKNVEKKARSITIYERLFGTNTPDGVVNHIENLIEPINNRIFIKGRAGTGKSVFMKKVLAACELYGIDVELYHCSFDPNSIDMVMIRELDYCLFDSTPPHELFPTRESDKIIDLYEKTVTPETDEKYAPEIKRLTTDYKAEMKKGLKKLQATKSKELEREASWLHTEIKSIDKLIKEIVNK